MVKDEVRKIVVQITIYDRNSTGSDIMNDIDNKFNDLDLDLWWTKILEERILTEEEVQKETNDSDVFKDVFHDESSSN